MSNLVIAGDTSGSVTLQSPTVSGSTVYTLAAVSGTISPLVSGTAITATGTSIDFTGIPSWVKRITVMFSAVSSNGTSHWQVQIGSGSIVSTGYISSGGGFVNSTVPSVTGLTSGFVVFNDALSDARSGNMTITLVTGNTYGCSYTLGCNTGRQAVFLGGGNVSLSGLLDTIRITTVNGTDAFDAGTINIMYE